VLNFPDDLLNLIFDCFISESNDLELTLFIKLDVYNITWTLILILHHV